MLLGVSTGLCTSVGNATVVLGREVLCDLIFLSKEIFVVLRLVGSGCDELICSERLSFRKSLAFLLV